MAEAECWYVFYRADHELIFVTGFIVLLDGGRFKGSEGALLIAITYLINQMYPIDSF